MTDPIADFLTPSDHPVTTYLESLKPSSRITMAKALSAIAHILTNGQTSMMDIEWHKLRYPHTNAIQNKLKAKYPSGNTARTVQAALKGVLKECWRLKLMSADDYQAAVDLRPIKAKRLPAGRYLEADEVTRLIKSCQSDRPLDLRDAAMLAILYGTGIRRQEVVNLDLSDIDMDKQQLKIRRGKGDRDREVPFPKGTAWAIADWLKARGNEPGPLLPNLKTQNRLTPQSVYDTLQRLAAKAKVTNISPHDFRRTFISNLFDAQVDGSTVQSLAGHANFQTTVGYDRRGDRARRKAVDLIDVPYLKENGNG